MGVVEVYGAISIFAFVMASNDFVFTAFILDALIAIAVCSITSVTDIHIPRNLKCTEGGYQFDTVG